MAMCRSWPALAFALGAMSSPLLGQQQLSARGVMMAGSGRETFVLLSGMVGGVGGFRQLAALLVTHGYRVIVIDPYFLSVDSADVTFAAMARRVDAALGARGVRAAHIIAHAHGAGVALRLAATWPQRVADLSFLDAGALAVNRGPTLSMALRLAPVIAHLPGGSDLIRHEFVRGVLENTGRREWFDAAQQRVYTQPILSCIGCVVAMAQRLSRSREPEPLSAVVSRVHVRVLVLLGDVPHPAGAGPEELSALEPLGLLVRVEHLTTVGHFPHEEAPNEVLRYLMDRDGG